MKRLLDNSYPYKLLQIERSQGISTNDKMGRVSLD